MQINKIMLWACLFSGFLPAEGQLSDRIRTMIAQIGIFKEYLVTAEEGYRIVEGGLGAIKGIKNEEYDLHVGFYTSLLMVNPAISAISMTGEVVALYTIIQGESKKMLALASAGGWFQAGERSYLKAVCKRIMEESRYNLYALAALLSDGVLQLTDEERLAKVLGIHRSMWSNYRAIRELKEQVEVLSQQRKKDLQEEKRVGDLYGGK